MNDHNSGLIESDRSNAVAVPSLRKEDSHAVYILLVSADTGFREQLRLRLAQLKWNFIEARNGAEALEALQSSLKLKLCFWIRRCLTCCRRNCAGWRGKALLISKILTMNSVTGHLLVGSSSPTTFARRLADLLYQGEKSDRDSAPKPANRHTEYVRSPASGPKLRGMIGDSPVMQHVYSMTHMVAQRDTTVLILGESGTGKDLVAQAIHMISPRQHSPFVVVNCAAIPEALLEAELFGYAKGAFTGAMQSRIGRIHAAHGGTLFLDEIGDMPLSLQSKLLRFIEQGEVQRLGSNDNLRVDVRVVAATNAGLPSMVKEKQFREDLFYRLSVFPIRMAPLRERGQDVISLAHHFATKFSPGVTVTQEALDELCKHDWPGNVRELRNVMERASIMAGSAREISASDIQV